MDTPASPFTEYHYPVAGSRYDDEYLIAPVLRLCKTLSARRVIDIGCGNGELCRRLSEAGLEVVGCDVSRSGIDVARASVPDVQFFRVGVDDDPRTLGVLDFDVAICTEVIEHLVAPRTLMRFARAVIKPGGHFVLSTPYHGYVKNLVLSITNGWDAHWAPLWDGGHIKFWSARTLRELGASEGFVCVQLFGVGRWFPLWKSMIGVFRTPPIA